MNGLPEDRGSELRALFFESANELLQSLNEAGLELEVRPTDEETIRRIRRVVHTLKGDAAACGFHQLSDLAHELEHALTAQVVQAGGVNLAELVLAAADIFSAMLVAYGRCADPPSAAPLQGMIRDLVGAQGQVDRPVQTPTKIVGQFAWTEYEQLMILETLDRGELVYNIALHVDPSSPMRAAAFQLIRNVLHTCGTLIALRPEDNVGAASVEIVEAALASTQTEDKIAQRCRIPSIVSDVHIQPASSAGIIQPELLDDLLAAHPRGDLSAGAFEQSEKLGASIPNVSATASVYESSLRVDAARIDSIMNLVGELIIGKSMLNRSLAEFDRRHARDPIRAKLADAMAFQARVLAELHKCVLKVRMVPVEQLFRRFPRVVRDVAKQCGKDVALQVSGQNTDLDKSVLDSLGEPLMHLVRNAVDHGIEPADQRIAAGKPARGTVYLNAYHQGTQVVIEVRDDGRGMDPVRLRTEAVQKGILKPEQAARLTDQEACNLVFEPGFSTASVISEVSGRGVGMDIVRNVLDRLKGTVHIISSKGRGSTIQLRAPLTLASIHTLLFRVDGKLFAVPLSSVVEITRIQEQEIHLVDQREVLRLRDQVLTLVRLNRLDHIHAIELPKNEKRKFVIVIGAGEKRFGLVVDALVGEEELVIKALPSDIVSSDLVSGASILGDGTVVLILNIPAVLSRFARVTPLGAIA